MSPLQFIELVNSNQTDAVRAALSADPSLATSRPFLGTTPLHCASHRGFAEIVELLLDAGADVHAVETASGTTPLHWACEGGHRAIAEKLVARGADLEAVDEWFGLTPLGWATVVRWASKFYDDKPGTAAWMRSAGARVDVFSAMITNAEIDRSDLERRLGFVADGMTPLLLAVSRRMTLATRRVLDLGANANALSDSGLSAMALAEALGDIDALKALRAHGAVEDASYSMLRGDLAAMEKALGDGTPGGLLFVAARHGRGDAIRLLVQHGADPNARSRRLIQEHPVMATPLHVAAMHGQDEAVRALLECGADVNAGSPTALHLAAGQGHVTCVGVLLGTGADRHARDEWFDTTPESWAEHGNHSEVVALLRAG